ncbi:MAG: UPF0104 family protein [Methanobrevibacter sp.]|jgi:uncharacterized protein (TIRG00374 family)|nr:UPF0104 family protein [Methanobrevibacter sp.]
MKYKTVLFFLFGLLIFGIMIYFEGIDNLIYQLKTSDVKFIVLASLVQVGSFILLTLRWQVINKMTDINISFFKILPITFIGLAITNLTPSSGGGGEPVRAYILSSKTKKPFESIFASVVADRTLDTIPFLILAIITIVYVVFYFPISNQYTIAIVSAIILITALFLAIIFMSINKKFAEKVIIFILRFSKIIKHFYKKDPEALEEKIREGVFGFQDTMKIMLHNKNVLYKALPLSFLIWFFEILRVYLIFIAFGGNANIIVIPIIFIVSTLIGMIPLLPGGLGATEVTMVGLFNLVGVNFGIATSVTMIERIISFWVPICIGLTLLPYYSYPTDEDKDYKNVESQIIDEFENTEKIEEIFNENSDEDDKKEKK